MTLSETHLNAISEHIIDVVNYLNTSKLSDTSSDLSFDDSDMNKRDGDNIQHMNHTQSESKSQLEPERFSILVISNVATANAVQHYIKQSASKLSHLDLNHLDIILINVDDFEELSYDRRYTLACVIDPIFDKNNAEDLLLSGGVDVLIKWGQLKTIAIKLRDLFAQQSLIFLSTHHPNYPLNRYGFEMAVLETANLKAENIKTDNLKTDSESHVESTMFNRPITCWQFNLYDYKRCPDWLNAKYWANPENFNKYRW